MRIKIGALLIAVALVALTYGSAAITSVTIDRTITATVKSDIDANVAVKFTALGTYSSLMSTDADGVVSFNLSKVLTPATPGSATGFNADAQFTIGKSSACVFQITNNSNLSITATMSGGGTNLVLKDSTGATSSTIAPGAAKSFYFEIDTTGKTAGSSINGTLQIRKA